MDRRDGANSQAPPRPPKLLARVHRPRAPEPDEMLNTTSPSSTLTIQENQQEDSSSQWKFHQALDKLGKNDDTTTENSNSPNATTATGLNRNNISSSLSRQRQGQQQQQQQQQQRDFSIRSAPTLTPTPATTSTSTSTSTNPLSTDVPEDFLMHGLHNRSLINPNNVNVDPNRTFIINTNLEENFLSSQLDYDNYQIQHPTYLPQRPRSLNRNHNHAISNPTLSSTSTSTSTSASTLSATATNSIRSRLLPATPGVLIPLLTPIDNNGTTSPVNALSHFQNPSISAAPVTLAQPRPENLRQNNEYVETPLRRTQQQQQLQFITRIQHPAGQHDNGATTTHPFIQLPQRTTLQRTQNQNSTNNQQQQQQIHPVRAVAETTTSVISTATTLVRNTFDNLLHSIPNITSSSTSTSSSTETNGIAELTKLQHHQHHQHHQHQQNTATTSCDSPATISQQLQQELQPLPLPLPLPITKQPASSTNDKLIHGDLPDTQVIRHQPQSDLSSGGGGGGGVGVGGVGGGANNNNNFTGTPIITTGHISPNSITCPTCGMCRCEQCKTPRLLPERWLCNKTCLCNAETVIDSASCLCFVKTFLYLCARDSEMDYDDGTGTSYLENPCSCGPYKRAERFGLLSAFSLLCPCLWCYWPMRGCAELGQLCYGYVAGRGCRCTQPGLSAPVLPILPQHSPNGSSTHINVSNNLHASNVETNNVTNSKSNDKSDSKQFHHYRVHHLYHDKSKTSQMSCEPEKHLLD